MLTGNAATVVAGAMSNGGDLLYMLVPKSATQGLAQILPPVDKQMMDGMRRSVIMRLDFASKTLSDVSSCVDEVSKKAGEADFCLRPKSGVSENSYVGMRALRPQGAVLAAEDSNTMNALTI